MNKDNNLSTSSFLHDPQKVKKLMKVPGNVRGTVFRTHAEYIRYRQGEEGVKAVEKKLKELGYPLKFKEFRHLGWYPEALSVLVIITAKELFNWTKSDIFDMGNSAPKYSFIVRLLMKTFLSIRRCFEETPKYWKKHYDFGVLEPYEINEKEKYVIVRLKEYKFHPIICIYFTGYFLRVTQFVLKNTKITSEETKCMFKGDPYHEFLVKWQ